MLKGEKYTILKFYTRMSENELMCSLNDFDTSNYYLDNNQVVGLVDSDGNFSVRQHSNTNTFSPIFIFRVSQRDHSVKLLQALKAHFKVGQIGIENKETNSLVYSVTSRKDLINVIVPFFDQHPLVTSKALDYLD